MLTMMLVLNLMLMLMLMVVPMLYLMLMPGNRPMMVLMLIYRPGPGHTKHPLGCVKCPKRANRRFCWSMSQEAAHWFGLK